MVLSVSAFVVAQSTMMFSC